MITESLVKEVFDQLLTAIAAEADAAILSVRLPPSLEPLHFFPRIGTVQMLISLASSCFCAFLVLFVRVS